MKLQDAIDGYVHHIRFEAALSKTTVKHSASWLRGFLRWYAEDGCPDPVIYRKRKKEVCLREKCTREVRLVNSLSIDSTEDQSTHRRPRERPP